MRAGLLEDGGSKEDELIVNQRLQWIYQFHIPLHELASILTEIEFVLEWRDLAKGRITGEADLASGIFLPSLVSLESIFDSTMMLKENVVVKQKWISKFAPVEPLRLSASGMRLFGYNIDIAGAEGAPTCRRYASRTNTRIQIAHAYIPYEPSVLGARWRPAWAKASSRFAPSLPI